MRLFFLKSIKILVIASFFVPLFFLPPIWTRFIFPFIVPKVILFRSLVLLMLGCYSILLLLDYKAYRVKNTPITLAIILFFASFGVSTFLGVDWYRSLWDNHERMLGLFTFGHYVIYYFIATTILKRWTDWKVVLRWFLLAGSVVILLGWWQKFDPQFLLNQGNARVSATLGNAIYFAGYGLFLGFLALYLCFREESKNWRIVYSILVVLGFSAIFLSSTRGSLLGLLVGGGITSLLYLFQYRKNKKVRNTLVASAGILLVILGVLFIFRTSPAVSGIPALGKLLNAGNEITERSPRLMAWGIAIDSWKEKPIFGWGPNNFYYSFNKYYYPEFLNFGWGETWFDNAHNVVLNTLAVQGIVGLISYISLFSVATIFLWKKYKNGSLDIHTTFIGIGFLIAHFTHNIFVFENPTSYLYFFLFLAFINSIVFPQKEESKTSAVGSVSLLKITGVVILIIFFIFKTNINVARANTATFKTLQSIYTGDDPVSHYKKAISIASPHIDDVRNDIARAVNTAFPQYIQANRGAELQPLFEMAYEDMRKNRAIHPRDIRIHMQEAQMAQTGAQFLNRPTLILDAEKLLDEALTYSPERQQIKYMLAMISFQSGNVQKSEKLLLDTIEDNPRIDEGWWRLAFIYAQSGQIQKVNQLLAEAEKKNVTINPERMEYIRQIINRTSSSTASQ